MLNIVIPMAGLGSRFARTGHQQPKPLIPVFGLPMIEVVVTNLRPTIPHRFIFICQQAHEKNFGIASLLRRLAPESKVLFINGLTEGAACSVLIAEQLINGSTPLVIANCDQYIDIDMDHFLRHAQQNELDGLIMTMPSDHPKWSYARRGASGWVEEVREKVVISREATVGVYHFSRGSDFVRAAQTMVSRNERVNNEFYVAPVYNGLIRDGARIGTYDIGTQMHGLGTPEDLAEFLAHFPSERVLGKSEQSNARHS